MNLAMLKKTTVFVALFLLSAVLMQFAWQASASSPTGDGFSPEKVNLALRRTAHHLLAAAGDSTSNIPPVQQTAPNVWMVRLERPFDYDLLPALLKASFDVHGISQNYDVAILRCIDGMLELGYSNLDLSSPACIGRDVAPECYNLQVTFPDMAKKSGAAGWMFLLGGLVVALFYRLNRRWAARKELASRTEPSPTETDSATDPAWLPFANSRLDVANQTLWCGTVSHQLTYREAKLLHLFVSHPNQLLARSFILENVWADEGILVGRSVDVFVSRLRKLLREDAGVSIAAVHGVGYRMEVAG